MSAFVYLGTLALQTSINSFGTNIIVAHTTARKISSIFMMPWGILGTTLTTFCSQNIGAGKYSRTKKGIFITVILTWCWSLLVMLASYTIAPFLVQAVSATTKAEIIETATLYLKVNTLFYFIPSVICMFRNALQAFGNTKTTIFSSFLELLTKTIVALFLAPKIGYWGIIVSEPIAWSIMVIPLIVTMVRNPILKKDDCSVLS